MSEVIVITSGKGGVGKTTTTANVGTGLAQLDKKVVLIDTDIGLRNLDVVMGLENRIVYNLVDVVEGNCRIKQALIKDKKYPNLFLLRRIRKFLLLKFLLLLSLPKSRLLLLLRKLRLPQLLSLRRLISLSSLL